MKRTIIRVVFILSISFNAAFLIHLFTTKAQTRPFGPEGSAIGHLSLDLTETQKKQIAPVQLAMQRQNETIKKQITGHQGVLLEALKEKDVDRGEVNRCINNISDLQKKLQLNTVEEIIRVREYMNTDQCNCLIGCLEASMDGKGGKCTGSCCNPTAK